MTDHHQEMMTKKTKGMHYISTALEILDNGLKYIWLALATSARILLTCIKITGRLINRGWELLGEADFLERVYSPLDRIFETIGDIFTSGPGSMVSELIGRTAASFSDKMENSAMMRRVICLLFIVLLALWIYPPRYWGPWYSYQEGVASYYGKGDYWKTTACGETFMPGRMTAAHKLLPFGALVLVENLENGRQVVVRINDDGPNVAGRIIDLNTCAARKLGILDKGLAKVKLYTKKKYKRGVRYRGRKNRE